MTAKTGSAYISESMTYHPNSHAKSKVFDHGELEESAPERFQ